MKAVLCLLCLLLFCFMVYAQDAVPPEPLLPGTPIPMQWWIPAALGINVGIGLLKKFQKKIPKQAMPWVNVAATAGIGFATGGVGAILPTMLGVGGAASLTYALMEPAKKIIQGALSE